MATAPAKPRVMWVDIAKGISILAVVFLHLAILGINDNSSTGMWYVFSTALEHVRLPLFFMASGLFAAKIRTFTFAELFVKRTWLWGVPFLVWGAIILIARHLLLGADLDNFWRSWIRGFLFPNNGIWFLMALVVYTFIIWLLRKVRGRYVFAVALLFTVLSPLLGSMPPSDPLWSWKRLAIYFSSYCIGLYGRELVIKVADMSRWYIAVTLLVGLTVAEHYYPLITNPYAQSAANIVLIMIGLLTGVSVSVTLDGTALGRGLAYIGRHTLEIYLLNEILTWIFFLYVLPYIAFNPREGASAWTFRYIVSNPSFTLSSSGFWAPIIGLVFVVGTSILFRALIKGSRLDWIFTPPTHWAWMNRWIDNSRAAQQAREAAKTLQENDFSEDFPSSASLIDKHDPSHDVDPVQALIAAEQETLKRHLRRHHPSSKKDLSG